MVVIDRSRRRVASERYELALGDLADWVAPDPEMPAAIAVC